MRRYSLRKLFAGQETTESPLGVCLVSGGRFYPFRAGSCGRGPLACKCLRSFEQAREVVAEGLPTIPASPRRVLGIQVIEIDAPARANHLESLTTSLDHLYIFGLNRKVHWPPSLIVLGESVRRERRKPYSTLINQLRHTEAAVQVKAVKIVVENKPVGCILQG